MPRDTVYLDYNANAPVRPEAAVAVAEILSDAGNPSSVHRAGRNARRRLDDARLEVAGLVGATSREVVFTSGGSEANITALTRAGAQRLIVSAVEHDSVLETAETSGLQCDILPVDGEGRVDLGALETCLGNGEKLTLLSLMLANNETGAIQPVAEAAALARRFGAYVHCDAVQAAGKLPVSFGSLGVDYLSISSHKIGGPMGVGALIIREGSPLSPLMRGGGQEQGRRAGTENLPGIAGFGKAAAIAQGELDAFDHLSKVRDELETRIKAEAPDACLFSAAGPRLANTSCLTMPGVSSEIQLIEFDLAGICVSSGAACSSGRVHASHVLEAMGIEASAASEAIRVSFGWASVPEDADRFVEAWLKLYRRNREKTKSPAA